MAKAVKLLFYGLSCVSQPDRKLHTTHTYTVQPAVLATWQDVDSSAVACLALQALPSVAGLTGPARGGPGPSVSALPGARGPSSTPH